MEKLETNIITPKRNTGENADIIEDLEIMAQSIQAEFNNKVDKDEVSKMLETTNETIEQIMKDYDKKEVSGENIHINDSLEYDMPISINGGIKQEGEPNIDNPVEVKGVSGHYDITISTPSTEHQEQLKELDIPFTMYSGKLYKENGKWYRPIEWVKEKLLSTFNWESSSLEPNTYFYKNSKADNSKSNEICAYSNYFRGISNDNRTQSMRYKLYVDSDKNIVLRNSSITSLDNLKTFLNDNNVYIIYKLATPTVEEITDTTLIAQLEELEKAQSYDGITNVNSYGNKDNAPLVLSLIYVRSNRIRIENLEQFIGTDLRIALDTINGEVI